VSGLFFRISWFFNCSKTDKAEIRRKSLV